MHKYLKTGPIIKNQVHEYLKTGSIIKKPGARIFKDRSLLLIKNRVHKNIKTGPFKI